MMRVVNDSNSAATVENLYRLPSHSDRGGVQWRNLSAKVTAAKSFMPEVIAVCMPRENAEKYAMNVVATMTSDAIKDVGEVVATRRRTRGCAG